MTSYNLEGQLLVEGGLVRSRLGSATTALPPTPCDIACGGLWGGDCGGNFVRERALNVIRIDGANRIKIGFAGLNRTINVSSCGYW